MKLPVASRSVSEHKQIIPSVIAVYVIYFVDKLFHNFINIFIFITPFRNQKVLIGLPKIAACAELVSVLRKSETKT